MKPIYKFPNILQLHTKKKKNKRLKENDNDKQISEDKGMTSILSLTFSNIFTEENNTVNPSPLNIFHGLPTPASHL